MRILLADNNDSFTRNLEHLLVAATGGQVQVVPYARLRDIRRNGGPDCWPDSWPESRTGTRPDLVVISPGPGHPREYPAYADIIDSGVPVLGICMGMQVLNHHFGGETARLPAHPQNGAGGVHGKQARIVMEGRGRRVARYHSLHCSRLGQGLRVIATLCPEEDETPEGCTAGVQGSVVLAKPVGTVGADKPVEAGNFVGIGKAVEPSKAAKSVDTAKSVECAASLSSAESVESGNPVQSANAVIAGKSRVPPESVEPVESVESVEPVAYGGAGIVMGLCHESRPLMGLQFHPESFLTPDGEWYIAHALRFFHNR
ncbi:aminodeoxychorismate/anthranilate synthase component II [Desulfovibrio psychrotolerans]|uniref:Glutamine amidotransferase domain-containing protein n=1 Tax=Desulfovibrio psychrotolerans TaxID=415242 RepID=A0A7J0BZW4_9BACT|nr:aminodeoxychorismate/anthranilate synthase component II [Desulfovibrio psychrotolerans]GFM38484.1 hypothetical protein DSM19430T_31680 [Desulfovibrio psychrotolerans]